MQFIIAISHICEIFIPRCFLKRKYSNIILGKLQRAEMWHPVTDSIFSVSDDARIYPLCSEHAAQLLSWSVLM